jgi:hypothetical protein
VGGVVVAVSRLALEVGTFRTRTRTEIGACSICHRGAFGGGEGEEEEEEEKKEAAEDEEEEIRVNAHADARRRKRKRCSIGRVHDLSNPLASYRFSTVVRNRASLQRSNCSSWIRPRRSMACSDMMASGV